VEHDASEIWANTQTVVTTALARAGLTAVDVAAVGITNQRETTVVWDRATGEPVGPAIVWQDTRTQAICDSLAAAPGGTDRFRDRTGLPLATYFAGPKLRWVLDEVGRSGTLAFGTIDSWLLWKLSGGAVHATDPTNASRTLLMDLRSLRWDADIAAELGVPLEVLPEIRSSSEVYARVRGGPLDGVPIAGILGDQQAATFGQACLAPGEAKNTYGTGNFLLLNTGESPVFSSHGMITTVAYALAGRPPVYALEGSIAVTGSLVQWLRDNLGLIASADEIEPLAASVPDNGGAYIVPAFSGLFAPYWRPDARGAVVGLTRYVTKAHLARAALESAAYQTRDVVEAMSDDLRSERSALSDDLRSEQSALSDDLRSEQSALSDDLRSERSAPQTDGAELTELKVDGGMTANGLLMQFQADVLGVPVIRPAVIETTAVGAAYAAGLAVGFWGSTDEIRANWTPDRSWQPQRDLDDLYATWKKAVIRTLDWV